MDCKLLSIVCAAALSALSATQSESPIFSSSSVTLTPVSVCGTTAKRFR